MNDREIRRKAHCCLCQGKLGRILNMVDLCRKATWNHPTCGNVLTGESGGAMAILCDPCTSKMLDSQARGSPIKILLAIEFTANGGVLYHPVDQLERTHEDEDQRKTD